MAEAKALAWPEPRGRVSRPAPGCKPVWCKRGHKLEGANVYAWTDKHGRTHRHCVTCQRRRNVHAMRRHRAKRKAG